MPVEVLTDICAFLFKRVVSTSLLFPYGNKRVVGPTFCRAGVRDNNVPPTVVRIFLPANRVSGVRFLFAYFFFLGKEKVSRPICHGICFCLLYIILRFETQGEKNKLSIGFPSKLPRMSFQIPQGMRNLSLRFKIQERFPHKGLRFTLFRMTLFVSSRKKKYAFKNVFSPYILWTFVDISFGNPRRYWPRGHFLNFMKKFT